MVVGSVAIATVATDLFAYGRYLATLSLAISYKLLQAGRM